MRKGIMAMEGLEEVVEVIDAPEADVTDFTEAPEADMIEMNEAAGEVESIDEEIGEASDTAETLGKMEEALGESVEEGGMSEPAAEAVRIAVEHLTSRLGFPKSVKVFPAMEGFGDKKTRIQATKVAMESIAEIGKKIWAAIVATYEKAVAWIKKFYAHVMDASVKLTSRADALIKAAEAKSGKSAAGGTVSSKSFSKYLTVGADVPEATTFAEEFSKYVAVATQLGTAQITLAKTGTNELSVMMTSVSDDENGFEKRVELIAGVFEKAALGEASANKDLGGDGLVVKEQKLHFGNKSFYSTVVGDKKRVIELAGKVKFQLSDASGTKDVAGKEEVTALAPTASATVAEAVKAHMGGYKDFAETIKSVEKAEKDIKAAMAKMIKEGDKSKDGKTAGNAKVAANIARAYISAVTGGASALRSYDIGVCKAALDYVASSLKAANAGSEVAEVKAEK